MASSAWLSLVLSRPLVCEFRNLILSVCLPQILDMKMNLAPRWWKSSPRCPSYRLLLRQGSPLPHSATVVPLCLCCPNPEFHVIVVSRSPCYLLLPHQGGPLPHSATGVHPRLRCLNPKLLVAVVSLFVVFKVFPSFVIVPIRSQFRLHPWYLLLRELDASSFWICSWFIPGVCVDIDRLFSSFWARWFDWCWFVL